MAFYSETEKLLRRLDRERRALDVCRDAATVTAVDLVLHHGQGLGPTARRAGLTPHALRQAVHAHPEVAPILLGIPEGPPSPDR
ncbi:hypothetical protein ACFUTY_19615 [Streptomyces sp. NPDC057362]|uniref:hypothetical protein n=1 Tax=Streptomyces sp. NPDC057362 TaxID=3346106 RepID=UPI00364457A2